MAWFDRVKRLFRRKPPEFDYAAIRIGNVYVLPPTDEDVRAFRRKRRRELTRRGFVVAGIALGLGALTTPFWLWRGGGRPGVAEVLSELDAAKADPGTLKKLCTMFVRSPDPEIRHAALLYMRFFYRDQALCEILWDRIDNDPVMKNRRRALHSLLHSRRKEDVARLQSLYRSTPWSRATIDQQIEILRLDDLRRAIHGR